MSGTNSCSLSWITCSSERNRPPTFCSLLRDSQLQLSHLHSKPLIIRANLKTHFVRHYGGAFNTADMGKDVLGKLERWQKNNEVWAYIFEGKDGKTWTLRRFSRASGEMMTYRGNFCYRKTLKIQPWKKSMNMKEHVLQESWDIRIQRR